MARDDKIYSMDWNSKYVVVLTVTSILAPDLNEVHSSHYPHTHIEVSVDPVIESATQFVSGSPIASGGLLNMGQDHWLLAHRIAHNLKSCRNTSDREQQGMQQYSQLPAISYLSMINLSRPEDGLDVAIQERSAICSNRIQLFVHRKIEYTDVFNREVTKESRFVWKYVTSEELREATASNKPVSSSGYWKYI